MTHLIDALVGLPPWLVLALVFALPAAEAALFVGVFVPGETSVLIGGVVAHGGGLPLWAVIVAAVAGAVIGDEVGFLVGRRYGSRLIEHFPARVRRSGELDRALDLVRRRGAMAVALGRWAAVLRALVPGAAGTSGMTQLRFSVANVTGGTLWAVTIAVAGYVVGASYQSFAGKPAGPATSWSPSSCSPGSSGGSAAGASVPARSPPPRPPWPELAHRLDARRVGVRRPVRRPRAARGHRRRTAVSSASPPASRTTATMPSSHQWLPVAATTSIVTTTCSRKSQRQRLVLAATMPSETTAAQATWIEGIAANWSETPVSRRRRRPRRRSCPARST